MALTKIFTRGRMKILKRFIKKNPVTLNIPVYSVGGSIDRVNFFLNSLLLFIVMVMAYVQDTNGLAGILGKCSLIIFALVLQVNNVFKRFRDISGKELTFSDKSFFALLTLIPIFNIGLGIYLSYKIGYLEIIKRRNALLKEMI